MFRVSGIGDLCCIPSEQEREIYTYNQNTISHAIWKKWHKPVDEILMQYEVKPSAVFGSRPPECCFFMLHKCGGALTVLKCFLVIFVWSVHFVESNCISFQPSDNQ